MLAQNSDGQYRDRYNPVKYFPATRSIHTGPTTWIDVCYSCVLPFVGVISAYYERKSAGDICS